ncbi:hypothetical protein BC835DRAFT_1518998 [Cytidiella melzeri]|nr:hypothetical protein BC835DRAFT_1518998 [Cytidiella melzeri]
MQFSIPLLLASIVTGMFHTAAVSAMPYSGEGSGGNPNKLAEGRSTGGSVPTPTLKNYGRSHLYDQTAAADSMFDKRRLRHQSRAIPIEMPRGLEMANLVSGSNAEKGMSNTGATKLRKMEPGGRQELIEEVINYRNGPDAERWIDQRREFQDT